MAQFNHGGKKTGNNLKIWVLWKPGLVHVTHAEPGRDGRVMAV